MLFFFGSYMTGRLTPAYDRLVIQQLLFLLFINNKRGLLGGKRSVKNTRVQGQKWGNNKTE